MSFDHRAGRCARTITAARHSQIGCHGGRQFSRVRSLPVHARPEPDRGWRAHAVALVAAAISSAFTNIGKGGMAAMGDMMMPLGVRKAGGGSRESERAGDCRSEGIFCKSSHASSRSDVLPPRKHSGVSVRSGSCEISKQMRSRQGSAVLPYDQRGARVPTLPCSRPFASADAGKPRLTDR